MIGVDIHDRFPSPQPDDITLQIQDIQKSWPAEWKASFDYVHQNSVLTIAGSQLQEIITSLMALVNPGGWIELSKPQHLVAPDDGPAHHQFYDMVNELRSLMGTPIDYANMLESIIRQAGFEEIHSVHLPMNIGKSVPDNNPKLQELTVQGAIESGKSIIGAGKSKHSSFLWH